MKYRKVIRYTIMILVVFCIFELNNVSLNAATSKTQDNEGQFESEEIRIDNSSIEIYSYGTEKNTVIEVMVKESEPIQKVKKTKNFIMHIKHKNILEIASSTIDKKLKMFNKNMKFIASTLKDQVTNITKVKVKTSVVENEIANGNLQESIQLTKKNKDEKQKINRTQNIANVYVKTYTRAIFAVQKEERERIRKQTLF